MQNREADKRLRHRNRFLSELLLTSIARLPDHKRGSLEDI